MTATSRRKFVLIGIVCLVVLGLVAVFAVPAIAAGSPPWALGGAINNNVTRVEGTVASLDANSITVSTSGGGTVTLAFNDSTNFTIHGNGWLSPDSLVGNLVTAVYNNSQTVTPPVASQVMINMSTPASRPGNAPVNSNFARAQGTLAVNGDGTISITPSTGAVVGPLTLDANTTVTLHGAALALNGSTVEVGCQ